MPPPPFPAFPLPNVQRATRAHVTTATGVAMAVVESTAGGSAGVDDAAAAVHWRAWSSPVRGTNNLAHKDIVCYTNTDKKYNMYVPTARPRLRSHWRTPWRLALSCTWTFPICSSTVGTSC